MTVLVFMLWLLILKWHPQDRPLVFYWGQSYLKQIEEQTPVSRNKFEKQILPLLHVPAYAALPASVISVVMPCFYIAGTLLLGTFLFSFLDSEPVMLNTSSKYNLYRFFWSHKLSCARLNFWLGDLQKTPKATGDGAAGIGRHTLPCQSLVSKWPSMLLGLCGTAKL